MSRSSWTGPRVCVSSRNQDNVVRGITSRVDVELRLKVSIFAAESTRVVLGLHKQGEGRVLPFVQASQLDSLVHLRSLS